MKNKILTAFIITSFLLISFSGGFDNTPADKDIVNSFDFSETQKGIPYFSYFSNKNFISKEIFSIVQDKNGNILMANRRGIVSFDSKQYEFIETPGMPVKLKINPNSNKIFVTCNNSFGVLKKSDSNYVYSEFDKVSKNFMGKTDIYFDSNKIYFDYRTFIAIVKKKDTTVSYLYPPENNYFGGIAYINGKYCALIPEKGFIPIQNDSVSREFYPFSGTEINFSIKNKNHNVFLTYDNQFFYVKNNKEFVKSEDSLLYYLHDKIVSGAITIDENKIAFYTMNGGIVFFDLNKEKIHSVLNTYTGLPENEVFSITLDNKGGLWVANNFGLFRYDFSLPIMNYAIYPGLEGKILSSQLIDTNLYVLTTKGVYYLVKPKSDREFEQIIEKKPPENSQKSSFQNEDDQDNTNDIDEIEEIEDNNISNDDQDVDKEEDKKKKENIFQRWSRKIFGKRKKKKDKDKNKDDKKKNQTPVDTSKTDKPDTTTKIVSDTTEIDTTTENVSEPVQVIYKAKKIDKKKRFSNLFYIYKKVEDINAKCKQSVVYNNRLFVASNSGLYMVENNKATEIISNQYITEIEQSTYSKNILYVASTSNLYSVNMSEFTPSAEKIIDLNLINDYVFSISETDTAIWTGGEGFVYKIGKKSKIIKMYPVSPDFLPIVNLIQLNNKIFSYVPQGMYKYNNGLDSLVKYKFFKSEEAKSVHFIKSQKNIIWYKLLDKWKYQSNLYKIDSSKLNYMNIIKKILDIKIDNNNNLWIVSNNNSLYKIFNEDPNTKKSILNLKIKHININEKYFTGNKIELKHSEDMIAKIELSTPYYIRSKNVKYQYSVSNKLDEKKTWSDLSTSNKFEIPLNSGTYFIHFRAKNILNQMSNIETLEIEIKPPFWKTDLFKVLIGIGAVLLVILFAAIRQKTIKKRNIELEKQVKQRTAEISKQNEELKVQKDEIQRQNEIVNEQKNQIQRTNDYITQSITYARRIQRAILPAGKILLKNFSDYFIIAKPRDIVSGDFYWIKEHKGKIFITVADCTGHGVPGAFLSMLGTAFLNEITTYKETYNAGQILNSLRFNVIYALQEKEDNNVRDGMDISLAVFDFENNEIDFAGAYHSLYLYRNNDMQIFKGDRMPIGYSRKNDIKFSSKKIKFQKDDVFYFFTDGYPDQFGEKERIKFMVYNFRKLLKSIADAPLSIQKELLNEAFHEWKGNERQIDDVTVMGVKI